MTQVILKGMFGSRRRAEITLDASRNVIQIARACQTYRQNVARASFEISALVNPGYVITSDSF